MIVNHANLDTLFRGFKVVFDDTLKATPSRIDDLATRVPSTTSKQDFPIAAIVGSMREWVGDRVVQNIAAWKPTVENKNFELTVAVDRNAIEDDQYAVYEPAIRNLAEQAGLHPYEEALSWLGSDAFSGANGFDGATFFSASHTWPGGGYTTAQDNLTDEVLDAAAVWTGIQAMRSFRNPAGDPIGAVPNVFVCSADLQQTATELFLLPNDAAGASNSTYGLFERESIISDSRIASGYWMMLDCRRAIKPVINQRRREPEFVALTQPTDEPVFNRREFQYGVDYRGRVVGIAWWLAYGSDGSE